MTPSIPDIARALSEAQRRYLAAVGDSGVPYEPRHGTTANWALRHELTDTVIALKDDRVGPWRSFSAEERGRVGVDLFFGQILTPLGLQLRAYLQEEKR